MEITNKADNESLIVLDELGSGTDPVQGASLGISILDFLHKIGSITLATTHYPEIKNYALTTSGFENASSEFNLDTLSPTYRLLIGVPGKSMAFEIGEKLGLRKSILEGAKSQMHMSSANIEELLKKIYDDKLTIEKEKEKILSNSQQIERLKSELIDKENNLAEKKNEIIENAKLEAKNILLSAKQDADKIIKELSVNKNSSKIRNELTNKIKEISIEKVATVTSIPADKLKIGMCVFVNTLKQDAIVLSMPNKNNNVTIQIGNAKMQINVSALSYAKTNTATNSVIPQKVNSHFKSKTATTEINVIGYNVDEATFAIDKFLDDCALAKIETARIVHGKGTGALRNGIHTFLRKHPHVASFRLGTFGEGEMGVTVVEKK